MEVVSKSSYQCYSYSGFSIRLRFRNSYCTVRVSKTETDTKPTDMNINFSNYLDIFVDGYLVNIIGTSSNSDTTKYHLFSKIFFHFKCKSICAVFHFTKNSVKLKATNQVVVFCFMIFFIKSKAN